MAGQILIVDDQQYVLDIVCLMLEQLGYEVESTLTAADALRLLRENPSRFDLLMVDLMMPEISGPALVEVAVEVSPQTRILFMAGTGEGVPDGYQLLLKPFTLQTIRELVEHVLKRTGDTQAPHLL